MIFALFSGSMLQLQTCIMIHILNRTTFLEERRPRFIKQMENNYEICIFEEATGKMGIYAIGQICHYAKYKNTNH